MTKIKDLADAVRSANAGASWRTFDIMFDREDDYFRVRDSHAITKQLIGKLYKLPAESIEIYEYPPALTIKITMPRSVMAGNPEDTDIDGKQQHAPLLDIEIP